MKKKRAPRAAYKRKVKRLAPLKVCDRNRLSGSIGDRLRISTNRNTIRAEKPTTTEASTNPLPNPRLLDSINPKTIPPNASVARKAPHRSNFSYSPKSSLRLSLTCRKRMINTIAAAGILIKNTARQEMYCTNNPPRTGPIAVVMAVKPDQVPMARPRCSLSNDALIIARLPGTNKAPPMP